MAIKDAWLQKQMNAPCPHYEQEGEREGEREKEITIRREETQMAN